MDDDEPRAGEVTTPNYNWTLPTVGASDDAWGNYLNSDLLGIDSIVHSIDIRPSGVTISDTAPASPAVGALWWDSVGGQLYTFYNDGNSSQWVTASNATASLLPASTTVLGGVKVDGTTIKAAPDGTISTTVVPLGDNRIINGDMRIDQRNNGAGGTATSVYTIDRWQFQATQTKGQWGRNLNTLSVPAGFQFPYYWGFQANSAYAPVAGDVFALRQTIEADMVSDFAWGTAGAQPITLSFWASNNMLTGTFSGSIRNVAGTRSYPFTFSLPTAGAWAKFAITIPGDTGGTWVLSGNAGSIDLAFDYGTGSTYRGPAGAWSSGNYLGVTGSVSTISTNGAQLSVTGVKLEIGSVATPFNRQSLAKSQADCERYFRWLAFNLQGAASGASQTWGYPAEWAAMRAAPTISPPSADPSLSQTTTNSSASGFNLITAYGAQQYVTATASGGFAVFGYRCSASAEL